MCNTNKLKGRIIEMGFTYSDVAKAVGIAHSTLSQKITNIRTFDILEAQKIVELLGIESKDVAAYFFYSPSSTAQHE